VAQRVLDACGSAETPFFPDVISQLKSSNPRPAPHPTSSMPLILNPPPLALAALKTETSPLPYLIFYSTADKNGRMWCADCRDVKEIVKQTFDSADKPSGVIFEVGDQPKWRNPKNAFKQEYKISYIPTIIRLDESTGKEVARLVTSDILNQGKLAAFMK